MLTGTRLPSRFGRAAVVVFLLLCITSQPSNAIEGFYVGGAVGGEYADVDFKKSVGRIFPDTPVAFTSSESDAQDWVGSLKVVLGHRWNLTGRTYFSGEVDAALRLDNSVTGFLEGVIDTQNPDSNVFPGNWYLDKNHSVGFNAKLGYSPEGISFLGEGGSIYVIAGIQWLDMDVSSAHEGTLLNGEKLVGEYGKSLSAIPWLAGGGIEIGGNRGRLDLRATYTRYDADFRVEEVNAPDLRYDLRYEYEISEWGVYLGYTWSLGFGLGI